MFFNKSRKDVVWGESSLVQMIELYLNPDQQGIWEAQDQLTGPTDVDEATSERVSVAQTLLRELQPQAKYEPFSFLI